MEPLLRYTRAENLKSVLDPMDEAVDWLAGLESETRLRKIIQETRGVSQDEAIRRAVRAKYFASAASEYIHATRDARPKVAFLTLYYAYLNLCKMMIACSDESATVDGGITHGLSYQVSHKESRSLFTERLLMRPQGVFPVLYRVLTGRRLPIKTGMHVRPITMRTAYSRLVSVSAEFTESQGAGALKMCAIHGKQIYKAPDSNDTYALHIAGPVSLHQGDPVSVDLVPALLGAWTPTGVRNEHLSEAQKKPTADQFDISRVLDRSLIYMPEAGLPTEYAVCAQREGRMRFPQEITTFLVLYHLSSVVRYKPRFMDTLRDSDAWPLILGVRRHELYRGILLAISCVFQRTIWFSQE